MTLPPRGRTIRARTERMPPVVDSPGHGTPAHYDSSTAGIRHRLLSSARTRIVGWVLLLVLAALAIVTLLTWRLSIQSIDQRMDTALRREIEEFDTLTTSGIDPATGRPFDGVDEVLSTAITYNLAQPNEKFLGYVDGAFAYQSRQQAPVLLAQDTAFTDLVGTVSQPRQGRYDSAAGEVRYIAIPVELEGDPRHGVLVAAYFADQERAGADDMARLMLGAGVGTTLLAVAGAWVVAGHILRPIRDVTATARTITETDLSQRIPLTSDRPGDELGELVRTVNAMLDRVEAAVTAQRHFVDDAGHELRTPITIVRGHLEVLDPTDPEDVRDTIALVGDELMRMNRMVSDLLLLTKAEQPEFLHIEPVDVAALTENVVDKVTHLGDREWVLESTAQVDAVLDAQRTTQALVALADNACRHTSPGQRIAIGSRLVGSQLRFWVTDSGPGVPEGDQSRIFERFARGSSAPRSEGAGLGLAIVRAIAGAHGGRVELDSTSGQGATFTVALPYQPVPEETS